MSDWGQCIRCGDLGVKLFDRRLELDSVMAHLGLLIAAAKNVDSDYGRETLRAAVEAAERVLKR